LRSVPEFPFRVAARVGQDCPASDQIPPMEMGKARSWAAQEFQCVAGPLMRRAILDALEAQQWLLGCCMRHHRHLRAGGPEDMHAALYARHCKRTRRELSRAAAYRLAVRASSESIGRCRARCLALMAMLED